MTEWFIYFPPRSTHPQIIPKEIGDTDKLLDFLYETIKCRSIEIVRFSSPTDVIIVDEEGLLDPNCQISLVGTALTRGVIVGGIVIAQEGVRNGEPDIIGYPSMNDAFAAAMAAKTIAEMHYGPIGEEV